MKFLIDLKELPKCKQTRETNTFIRNKDKLGEQYNVHHCSQVLLNLQNVMLL